MQQPHRVIIFRGTGTKISAREREAYHKKVRVFWQRCARADAAFMNAWAVMLKTDTAFFNRQAKPLFLDSLIAHKDEAVVKTLKDRHQTDVHFLPRGMTNMLQAVDAGVGRTLKLYIARRYDAWLQEPANFRAVVKGRVKAKDKRVLISQFIGESWDMLCDTLNVGRAWKKCFKRCHKKKIESMLGAQQMSSTKQMVGHQSHDILFSRTFRFKRFQGSRKHIGFMSVETG